LLKEININNNEYYYKNLDLNYNIYEINKKLNTNFESNIKLYLSNDNLNECVICKSNTSDENSPLITLCECYIYKHFICLKNELKNEIKIVKNKNGNSINYFIKFHCNNCKIQLPLRFKIYGINKIFELIDIEKPKNEEYLLFESFDYLNFYNYYQRSIHLVKLIGNDNIINIKIGRDGYNKNNDIKLEEETTSMEHALIEYNKKEGILLLKNISKESNSLVLIKNSLKINENKIYLEVGRTFIEAYLIKENDLKKINYNEIKEIKSKEDFEEQIKNDSFEY
jgi:hypothetical protein